MSFSFPVGAPAFFWEFLSSPASCKIGSMATYVISDIHGALDEFVRMLDKIDFHCDGSDELYLLGDYCDWGAHPIETLQYVKEMDDDYPFVHPLIGNHEWMFLETLDAEKRGARGMDEVENNWFFNNRGLTTYTEYLKLSEEERREIEEWMRALPYSLRAEVNGTSYLMSHAYPYFEDVKTSAEEDARRKVDAVWRRLMIREDPFGSYEGGRHYDCFICGHTITEFYFYKLRFEHNWPVRKPDPSVRNRIFFGEKFIDIDCGAKCLSCREDPSPSLRRGALRGQLGCLRLDDRYEFYVHPVKHRIPGTREDMSRKQPTLTWPRFDIEPKVTLPGIRPSEMGIPDIDFDALKKPEMKMPEIHFHQMSFEDLKDTLTGRKPGNGGNMESHSGSAAGRSSEESRTSLNPDTAAERTPDENGGGYEEGPAGGASGQNGQETGREN